MIKSIKYALLCTALFLSAISAFSNDENNSLENGASENIFGIKVYDAKEKLVCELTSKNEIYSFSALLEESVGVAADAAAFTRVPENTQVLYRYDIFNNSPVGTRLFIYADGKTAYIPDIPEDDDMPEVFAWELFADAYKILSQPASIKKALTRYENKHETVFAYDAKGTLVSSIKIHAGPEALLDLLQNRTGNFTQHRFETFLPEKSLHKGRKLLYRYTVWTPESFETIRLYIYNNTKKAVISSASAGWADFTFSKKDYELFKNPEKLMQKIKEAAEQNTESD